MISSAPTVIVTGINGFVGEHLARHLRETGHRVIGVGREAQPVDKVATLLDGYFACDLLDASSTKALELANADSIIHLAGLASVGESFKHPELYLKGNADMTGNLLNTAADQGFTGRAVIISTGAVYDSHQPQPLSESSSLGGEEPSPYALGKIKAEQVALSYKDKGMSVVVVRPFNHIGPGQGPGFLLPDITQAVRLGTNSIQVGDLSTRRDYTDVRDIVRAYTLLADAPNLKHDIYNVSSGVSKSGQEIVAALEAAMGSVKINCVVDPSRLRPGDPKDIVGDCSRIKSELHWSPEISFETTVRDFVNGS